MRKYLNCILPDNYTYAQVFGLCFAKPNIYTQVFEATGSNWYNLGGKRKSFKNSSQWLEKVALFGLE